jgi:hypothetical protein
MERYDNTRFRITLFPAQPVPLPRPVFTDLRRLVSAEDFLISERATYSYSTVEYGELYLELESVDLASDDAIVDFATRHHALGVFRERPEWLGVEGDVWFYPGFAREPGFEEVSAFLEEVREKSGWEGAGEGIETLDEFRWGAWILRDMTTAWRVIRGDTEHDEAVWEAPCWKNGVNRFSGFERDPERTDFRNAAMAPWVIEEGLRMALQPFPPRALIVADGDAPSGPHGRRSEEIPLFSILALELFNHIAEDADYRRCANETCGRFFVRQSGRALHGQHRTRGVKYCSNACARMQASREYRRRKAKAKNST